MITQSFLLEFEGSLLRSFAKASRKVTPRSQREPNFLGNAQFKEEFVKEFLTALQERKPTLENEVLKGGHRNYEDLTKSIGPKALPVTVQGTRLSDRVFNSTQDFIREFFTID